MKKQAIQILAIVLSTLALGYGVYLTFFERVGFVKASAVIEQIDENYLGIDSDGQDEYSHDVYIRFTTADGEKIRTKCDTYKSGYTVGKWIPIWYNPQNPTEVHGDNRLLGVILMLVGPVLAVGTGIAMAKERRGNPQDGNASA